MWTNLRAKNLGIFIGEPSDLTLSSPPGTLPGLHSEYQQKKSTHASAKVVSSS